MTYPELRISNWHTYKANDLQDVILQTENYEEQMFLLTTMEIEYPVTAITTYITLLSQPVMDSDQLINLIFRLSSCLVRMGGTGRALYYLLSARLHLWHHGVGDYARFEPFIINIVRELIDQFKLNHKALKVGIAYEVNDGLNELIKHVDETCRQESQPIRNIPELFDLVKTKKINQLDVLFISPGLFNDFHEFVTIVNEIKSTYEDLDIYPLAEMQELDLLASAKMPEFVVVGARANFVYSVLGISLDKRIKKFF